MKPRLMILLLVVLMLLMAPRARAADGPEYWLAYTSGQVASRHDTGTRLDGTGVTFERWAPSGTWALTAGGMKYDGESQPDFTAFQVGFMRTIGGERAVYIPVNLIGWALDQGRSTVVLGMAAGAGLNFKAGNHLGLQVEGLYNYLTVSDDFPQRGNFTGNVRLGIRF